MSNITEVKEKLKSKNGLSKKETESYSLIKYIGYLQKKCGVIDDIDCENLSDMIQKLLYAIDRIKSCDSSLFDRIPDEEKVVIEKLIEFSDHDLPCEKTEIEIIKIEVDTFVEMTSFMFDTIHLIYMLEFEMSSSKFDIGQFNEWLFDMELNMGRIAELRKMLNIEREEDRDFDNVSKAVLKKAKDYMNNKRYLDD